MEIFFVIASLCQIQGRDSKEIEKTQHQCQAYYIDCIDKFMNDNQGHAVDERFIVARCVRNKGEK